MEDKMFVKALSFRTSSYEYLPSNRYILHSIVSGIGREKYQVEKYDRTLDKRFNFKLPDWRDYRLIVYYKIYITSNKWIALYICNPLVSYYLNNSICSIKR